MVIHTIEMFLRLNFVEIRRNLKNVRVSEVFLYNYIIIENLKIKLQFI